MIRLSVERLFSDPPLTGALPASMKFAPDGSYLAYLRSADDDRLRLDLWRYDLDHRSGSCWIDARRLLSADSKLTDAEKAERERKRQFSNGITRFDFSSDGRMLLLPVDGAGYLLNIADDTLHQFTPPGTRQTDFQFSPNGSFVSYVRANNLYYWDIAAGREHQVTDDGSDLVANGIAEFIAQEEMHRFSGHWWSPDESSLAFTSVDESPIEISRRYEIDAEEFNVIEQRYPYAGACNADVALKVFDLVDSSTRTVDWRHAADDYLARVDWAGSELALQVQSRDQQSLNLDFVNPVSGSRRNLLHESSDTWINLHDNFKALDPERFLWTSERDGNANLYLYSNGNAHQLTNGECRINRIVHVDSESAYVAGWFGTATEQHLYRISLAGGEPEQITHEPGWHDPVADNAGHFVVDRFSSLGNPGSVYLYNLQPDSRAEPPADKRGSMLLPGFNEDNPYQEFLDAHCRGELGELTAEDGQILHYRLTRPKQHTGPLPLIISVYGGPGVQRVKNEWAPLTTQLFAQRGFGVLELDNRGSGNRSRIFEAPIYRQLGSIEVADQLVGAAFAGSLDWVDSERIGVFGHSYGGYMTLMCLTRAPDIFKAGVSVAPVTDWRLYDTHYTERYLRTPEENSEGYLASSVFPYLKDLRGRLLIIHGMADDNVLFTNSTRIFKALQQRMIPFEMMTYPGSKHALQEREVAIHRFNLILDFFERSL